MSGDIVESVKNVESLLKTCWIKFNIHTTFPLFTKMSVEWCWSRLNTLSNNWASCSVWSSVGQSTRERKYFLLSSFGGLILSTLLYALQAGGVRFPSRRRISGGRFSPPKKRQPEIRLRSQATFSANWATFTSPKTSKTKTISYFSCLSNLLKMSRGSKKQCYFILFLSLLQQTHQMFSCLLSRVMRSPSRMLLMFAYQHAPTSTQDIHNFVKFSIS